MKIAVTAGKGGTGKTTVATNLALSLSEEGKAPVQLLDCDVEEPDAHIFLNPEFEEEETVGMKRPQIDQEKCNGCGTCADLCVFNAIAVLQEKTLFYPELCHGCGLCSLACPQEAITEIDHQIGIVQKGRADGMEFLQGELTIGDPLAPPIIDKLKKNIRAEAISILDSPPGTACPAVETIHNCDFALLVTEPTPFGLHDLKLTIKVCRSLGVPYGVVINRKGIGDLGVEEYCREEGIPVLLEIPDSREIAELYARGVPFAEEKREWKEKFISLFQSIKERSGKGGTSETVTSD